MTYTLRSFEAGDASALAALTLDAIETIGVEAYTAEQVRVWANRHPSPERFTARAEAGHRILVMVDDASNAPAAYSLLEGDGHLDMLYCAPAHAGRGLAKELLVQSEKQARELGMAKIYTEASELARPAFEKAGYTLTERRDFEIDGVAIHNYAMEKPLG